MMSCSYSLERNTPDLGRKEAHKTQEVSKTYKGPPQSSVDSKNCCTGRYRDTTFMSCCAEAGCSVMNLPWVTPALISSPSPILL